MKKQYLIYIGLLLVGVITGAAVSLMFGASESQPKGDATTEQAKDETWTCSMHPQIRQSDPGDCPICGMDLIPLESDAGEINPLAISMSPAAMQLASVQTLIVGREVAQKKISLMGKVQPDERLVFTQSAHIPGRIEQLNVSFTGELVREGQEIASVYSPELVTAQQELLEAATIQDTQPALFQAAKQKLKNWKLTDAQIDKILASNQVEERFPILANVSGYVLEKQINLGDYVKIGQSLFRIADLSKVWLLFDVYESDLQWVSPGNEIRYTIASLPSQTFTGKVTYLDPTIDPSTRVAKARVEMPNPKGRLKPGMFASGELSATIREAADVLSVPKSAVMWTGKRSIVYIKHQTDQGVTFQLREVTLGTSLGDSYLVEEGLEVGEEIAVSGTFSIDAAAQLAAKPSMMSKSGSPTGKGHQHGANHPSNTPTKALPYTPISISQNAKAALQPLFEHYFAMKTALAEDDFPTAQSAGKAMRAAVQNVDMKLLAGTGHEVWMQLSASLSKHLLHIEHREDLEDVRKPFIAISQAMIGLAESFDPLEETIYLQYCPMADDNQGANWLSKEAQVINPYFGSSMLKCGEVKKEIK